MDQERRKKMMEKVASLIAKAEATDYSEERDAFRAKADELMVAYAIEESELVQRQGRSLKDEVKQRRIRVAGADSPYRDPLVSLIASVARHARCRIVFYGLHYGVSYPVEATVVGMEQDLDYVEMLFASLRLQMANELEPKYDPSLSLSENVYQMRNAGLKWERIHPLAEAAGVDTPGRTSRKWNDLYEEACFARGESPRSNVNPKTVKRNFAEGYVPRVEMRFLEVRRIRDQHTATSTALVPVRSAVDEAYREMFPKLGSFSKKDNRKTDYQSWGRGSEAGKRADLGQGRVAPRKELGR